MLNSTPEQFAATRVWMGTNGKHDQWHGVTAPWPNLPSLVTLRLLSVGRMVFIETRGVCDECGKHLVGCPCRVQRAILSDCRSVSVLLR